MALTHAALSVAALYSLEKLIEWKLFIDGKRVFIFIDPLYSLEKLIEWKLIRFPLVAAIIALSTR
ncbi:hypothetical protein C789_963 [Microcystis aeruginosa FACHB-905 = DIANCHI905]|uniref:Uncharacterized protein n=1 Tax=Microcystis aeruginosa PCC 7806SL TaxID=1903187 RepID=A0AB33BXM1_MICA7|nr:hypothetical protein BH695_3764 [Microcystis aeruginosa PCC 7806SL]ELS49252.1 hypothetical protein C789_963 [Microcystis aeruginosa FACHB-905 = DIANCHI905]